MTSHGTDEAGMSVTYQISASGGKGSAVSALLAYEQGLDFNLIFADTRIEDEDLYRFNVDVAAAVKKDPVVLTDGRTPWDVFIDQRFIGNSRMAKCSGDLKTKPVKRWLKKNARPSDPLVLGMGWEECDRIERAKARWAPRPVVSLLMRYRVFRWQYEEILKRHGLKEPRLYELGFDHNNCGGFCVKAGQGQFARLLAWHPERYAFHEGEMERAMSAIGPTAKPFLKITSDGVTRYVTLREFREHVQAGGQLEMFSASGCGCFSDEEAA
jgi:3'-phosphoadenosine 5'-phosphosulfate sulfotransferase (PAPS reductase)/FAD synthetase